ncbi:MAG: DNA recombination protein RmuC [Bacteroidaceae bacterium]|nr:DNA recombination protein RmuC [Bacteroidaceae bacterium]
MNILLIFLIGIVLGAAIIGVLYFRLKSRHAEELQSYSTRAQILEAQCQAEKTRANEMIAQTEQTHAKVLAAQEARFQETLQRVTLELKSATDEMLKQRQQEFSQSSTQNLGQIVTPLKETIEAMRKAMDNTNLKHTELSSAMKEQIQMLMRQTESARLSAEELARVFKHGSKVQGDWGETVLCELLDAHGLTCGRHYDTQTTLRDAQGNVLKTEQGSMLRPDVILHLDNQREVIIDSKVSLTAFMDYVNAETEEERQRYLKAHVDSLQKHVKELSTKDYSSYICPPKVRMDYVIMFVPHSGALWTALNAQPDMWRRAMEKNVFIADEQTLFAALRIVSLTWTQIAQAENHEKVYTLANEMLDRVGQFMKKYQAMGKALENAQKAYEDGEKKLLPSGQSILQTCAKLQKLGAKQSTTNPLPQINAGIEE